MPCFDGHGFEDIDPFRSDVGPGVVLMRSRGEPDVTEFQMYVEGDFVNGSIEANLWRVSKQPDERVVDISGIIRAFFVIASIGDPAQDLVSKDIIALY